MTKSHRSHASVQPRRHHYKHRRNQTTILAWLSCLCVAVMLTACGGGGGGSDDDGGSPDTPSAQAGLVFSYPVDGQQGVFVKSQVVMKFRGNPGSLTLVAEDTPVTNARFEQDANQPGLFELHFADASVGRPGLQPDTHYAVRAASGTLITFQTRSLDGRPSPDGFSVDHLSSIGNIDVPFTVFNPIRAHFSEPVNASSADLCRGGEALGTDCTVSVAGPNGNVSGTLMILGSDMTFDPDDGTDTNATLDPANYTGDLQAGATYTVAFDGLKSEFGNTLTISFQVTPVAIGQDVVKALAIEPTTTKYSDSPLTGGPRNVAYIVSQLIGVNEQDAQAAPQRGGLISRLAEPSDDPRYEGTFPALIPAGQKFQLEPISLKLGGEIQTPVVTGPIQTWFVNDASVFIVGNSLSGLKTPTMVVMRLDLAISTQASRGDAIESMSNGVFNQTAMNVIAAGLAIPQDNGDVKLITMGSFPVAVNRTGNAITDFELEVTLPNPKAGRPVSVGSDQVPPRITAVYPSACLYTFGTPAFDEAAKTEEGIVPVSLPERDCESVLEASDAVDDFVYQRRNGETIRLEPPQDDYPPYVNGFPLQASPSIVFSEPVDPSTLDGNIRMFSNGMAVEAALRVEGTSVVIDPSEPVKPDTAFTIKVRRAITDLAGNNVELGRFATIEFTTRPIVVGDPGIVRQTAPFLTVLTPGLPCALNAPANDSYLDGGNTAGRCVGDSPRQETVIPPGPFNPGATIPGSPKLVYGVFEHPANVGINAHFSKRVDASSIVLADGCFIHGSGNKVSNATVAVQIMEDGQCKGVVDGDIALLGSDGSSTWGFTFRPSDPFKVDQRYLIVVCGSPDRTNNVGVSQCGTGSTVVDVAGRELNTNPLISTGTQVTSKTRFDPTCGTAESSVFTTCFSDDLGGGGPDIVMPFVAIEPTQDFYATTLALPKSDTNGNGFVDADPADVRSVNMANFPSILLGGTITSEDRGPAEPFNDVLGEERFQPANRVLAFASKALLPVVESPDVGFLAGGRPIAIRDLQTGDECEAVMDVKRDMGTPDDPSDDVPVVGDAAPTECIPVALLPGGYITITSIAAGTGAINTGRLLLRFPYARNDEGDSAGRPQLGYIVEQCQGTFEGKPYNYTPCFVADLTLTVNGPDAQSTPTALGVEIPQQDIHVEAFGPVAFEQNGRLVISTRNANTFAIVARLVAPYGSRELVTVTDAGGQTLQLVGPAIHGGRAFPVR